MKFMKGTVCLLIEHDQKRFHLSSQFVPYLVLKGTPVLFSQFFKDIPNGRIVIDLNLDDFISESVDNGLKSALFGGLLAKMRLTSAGGLIVIDRFFSNPPTTGVRKGETTPGS